MLLAHQKIFHEALLALQGGGELKNLVNIKVQALKEDTKVLFTHCCRRHNFRPSLLQHCRVYSLLQKTKMKVLPSAMVGEKYFIIKGSLCIPICTEIS